MRTILHALDCSINVLMFASEAAASDRVTVRAIVYNILAAAALLYVDTSNDGTN